MAKKSAIDKNNKRVAKTVKYAEKRAALKAQMMDKNASAEERFNASLKMAKLPRDGSKVRVRLRCELSGRPRGNYRKFKLSRIALRELGSQGQIPGLVKSSW